MARNDFGSDFPFSLVALDFRGWGNGEGIGWRGEVAKGCGAVGLQLLRFRERLENTPTLLSH